MRPRIVLIHALSMSMSPVGEEKAHADLVAEAAAALHDCQSIMPAPFSVALAAEAVRAKVPCPVLSSPDAAVARLKALLV